MTTHTQSGAAVLPAPEAGGRGANDPGVSAPPPADPLAWLREADATLPLPMDAAAAAACLAAMHQGCEHARLAAQYLRAYAVAHNLRTKQTSGARP